MKPSAGPRLEPFLHRIGDLDGRARDPVARMLLGIEPDELADRMPFLHEAHQLFEEGARAFGYRGQPIHRERFVERNAAKIGLQEFRQHQPPDVGVQPVEQEIDLGPGFGLGAPDIDHETGHDLESIRVSPELRHPVP